MHSYGLSFEGAPTERHIAIRDDSKILLSSLQNNCNIRVNSENCERRSLFQYIVNL